MDDNEYYSLKRITSFSPEQLRNHLKKVANEKYRSNEVRQGKADAEMLLEKQEDFDSIQDED